MEKRAIADPSHGSDKLYGKVMIFTAARDMTLKIMPVVESAQAHTSMFFVHLPTSPSSHRPRTGEIQDSVHSAKRRSERRHLGNLRDAEEFVLPLRLRFVACEDLFGLAQ